MCNNITNLLIQNVNKQDKYICMLQIKQCNIIKFIQKKIIKFSFYIYSKYYEYV